MPRNQTNNGDLRTPIVFYSAKINEGIDGRDVAYEQVYATFAEVYNPSNKDITIANSISTKASYTVKMRDPLNAYQPSNKHYIEIRDPRLIGTKYQIIDIRPSFDERQFLTVVVGGAIDG
ncbi:phage head-tail adapter protein [Streptococcus chenjunshii]|uniref:Phage head-tail adapter protein n=1 Tax=Streptococcus chenjunshii TaxID=2173853 RepID=A0A372KMS3_9STRE|nr:phage head-tail adapter protein [Streptococcus chenjunshii]AXQ79427.1 phage head-tail adapter protein [Streptococcus chenjunshii]RFU51116.1 phage head-tail adapter protein [Streptococcus chenjunshii]RFU53214.1 phage head-tail adapter protein [Streptococcus chenjunshii]